jgi:peptidoglycan-N-acetylglucosamine deacetylase
MLRDWLAQVVPRWLPLLVDSTLCRVAPTAGEARRLYLSFDDGPSPETTPQVLKVLASFQAKATFFCLGQAALAHPALVTQIVEAGHTLGNHTWSHADGWRTSANNYTAELERASLCLMQFQGQPIYWFRPPYGHLTLSAIRWGRTNGQRPVLWDVILPDYNPQVSISELVQLGAARIRPGSIICLHDGPGVANKTPEALSQLIPLWQSQGYLLETLPSSEAWQPPAALAIPSLASQPVG